MLEEKQSVCKMYVNHVYNMHSLASNINSHAKANNKIIKTPKKYRQKKETLQVGRQMNLETISVNNNQL